MDWSIPRTFYPVALPAPWMWALFVLACLAAIAAIGLIIKYKGFRTGLLLAAPIAAAMLFASMIVSMVVMFLVHDI
jgi:mannose/fructose/N-acetylgalactosamine-specific phosphotransferase system component IIC